jgi:predicted methyltransferase
MRHLLSIAALVLVLGAPPSHAESDAPSQAAIRAAVGSPQRTAQNTARDSYRHPAETLSFFGVTPNQTLVEIWPDSGWYTEILAPLLGDEGKYIAATEAAGKARQATLDLIASDPGRFGKVGVSVLEMGKASELAPEGSADMVLTFRNVHNFVMAGGTAPEQFFADCYRALKPGGTLGVVDHHLPEEADSALEKKSGYIKRSTVVALATQAGFRLDGESPVNANPKDDHQHPKGVWTLPPIYALGDTDRATYQAIGESDRFTLRFVKPK